MFDVPSFNAQPFWYAGLIWALVMGWAASSYASNFSYRIPRGERPFGREPYCGDCNSKLLPKDLFPIFSWLFTGGKCRYCGSKVPASYFILELLYAPYVGLCYVAFDFSDMFIILAFTAMLLQISAMMAWDDFYQSRMVVAIIAMTGLIFQILQGHALQFGLISIFYGLFGAVILNALLTRKAPDKDVYLLPNWVWLIAASAAWLTLPAAGWFVLIWLVCALSLKLLTKRSMDNVLAIAQAPALLASIWLMLIVG